MAPKADVDAKLENILKEIREFKDSLGFLNKSIEDLKSDIADVLKKQKELVKEKDLMKNCMEKMKIECKNLRASLEFQERDKVTDMMEIAGLPERDEENLQDMVVKLAGAAGIKIEKSNIISAIRIKKKKKMEEAQRVYPIDIQVKFSNKETRDTVINAVKKAKLNSNDLGFGRQFNIYAREQLTFYGKQLYYKCLEFKKLKNWRFLWSKGGRIFLREKEGERCFVIGDFMDLEKMAA